MQPFQQEQGDQGCPNLDAQGVLTGADEGFHCQILLEGFEQVMDILPINMPPRLRFTTASIPCARRVCLWSGYTTSTIRSTMSCGEWMARRWRCRPG